mmetsp:Transcript_67735/g.181204  ORF Transcript_67735/g.181204 Transcript_67735/m.181204 type:complete len:105 (+) Transcript_67735:131-445(+)
MRSTVIKQMLEDLPEPSEGEEQQDPVPLMDRSCNSKILEKVIEYLTKHQEFDTSSTPQEDKDAWDKKYVEVEDEDLFNLILVFSAFIQFVASKQLILYAGCKLP